MMIKLSTYLKISLFSDIKHYEIGDEIFAIHYESFHQQLMVIYSGILWVAFKIVHRHIALELRKKCKKKLFSSRIKLFCEQKKKIIKTYQTTSLNPIFL